MSQNRDAGEQELSVHDFCLTPEDMFPVMLRPGALMEEAIDRTRLKSAVKARLKDLVSNESMDSAYECLYWYLFSHQFHDEYTKDVQRILAQKLANHYVRLLVSHMDQLHKNCLQHVPLILGHSICTDIYHRFSNSRGHFTEKFILESLQLVYATLIGVPTTEVYVRLQLRKIYGLQALDLDPMEECAVPRLTHETEERHVPVAVQSRMETVAGGEEFARELLNQSSKQTLRQAKTPQKSSSRLYGPAEALLEKVVRHHSTPQMRSAAEKSRVKIFNCVRLSPMLSSHFHSAVVSLIQSQVPYKSRVLTSHPLDLNSAMPRSIKLLQNHCEEKLKQHQEDLINRRQAEELARFKSSQSKLKRRYRLDEGLSRQGVEHSPCFAEVFKLRNALRDRPVVRAWASFE